MMQVARILEATKTTFYNLKSYKRDTTSLTLRYTMVLEKKMQTWKHLKNHANQTEGARMPRLTGVAPPSVNLLLKIANRLQPRAWNKREQ
jgi:hypothetical protein